MWRHRIPAFPQGCFTGSTPTQRRQHPAPDLRRPTDYSHIPQCRSRPFRRNPSVIDPDDMISLVDLVEKYECHSAITPHAQQWLQMDLEGHAQEDLWKVLRSACAIGSRHHSERICHQLIVSHLGPFHSWAFAVNNFGSMPQETLGMCNHY